MLPGLIHWVSLLSGDPVDSCCFWTPPELWDGTWRSRLVITPVRGLMVAWIPMLWQMFRLRALECIFLPLSWLCRVQFREEVEEFGDARLDRCRAFMPVPGPVQTV